MLCFGRFAMHADDGIAHEWMSRQICFDLTRLDPKATQFDLLVRSTKILNGAVGQNSSEIAGREKKPRRVRAVQVRDESLRGELGLFPVPSRQAISPDMDFSLDQRRIQIPVFVENEYLRLMGLPIGTGAKSSLRPTS